MAIKWIDIFAGTVGAGNGEKPKKTPRYRSVEDWNAELGRCGAVRQFRATILNPGYRLSERYHSNYYIPYNIQ